MRCEFSSRSILLFDLMMHVVYDERGLDEGCMMHIEIRRQMGIMYILYAELYIYEIPKKYFRPIFRLLSGGEMKKIANFKF